MNVLTLKKRNKKKENDKQWQKIAERRRKERIFDHFLGKDEIFSGSSRLSFFAARPWIDVLCQDVSKVKG